MTMPALVSRILAAALLTSLTLAQCPAGGSAARPSGPTPLGPIGQPNAPQPGTPATPEPAGPTTPRPTGPATPPPSGPITPRAGQPAPRAAPGMTGARGMPITFERGNTSKDRLKVAWTHPVPPERDQEKTSAAGPLDLQSALEVLWEGDDGRPLLVLRECQLCAGSDGALLSRSLANDKTMLLTKWFRTVKLPAHVTEAGHPFHNVFEGYDFEDGTPHFFLLAHRDAKPVAFTGTQTQSQLWQGMFAVLEQRYAKDPKKALKKWLGLLDRYDTLDARQSQLQEELYEVRANQGPDSAKAKKLTEALAAIAEERAAVAAEEQKVMDLGLLKMERTAAK